MLRERDALQQSRSYEPCDKMRLFSSFRDCSPPRYGRDGATVGTFRTSAWRLHTSLPAASLWTTARAARPTLPAPCAGAHQPWPTSRVTHQAVFRYDHFRALEEECGVFDSRATASRAGSSAHDSSWSSVKTSAFTWWEDTGLITGRFNSSDEEDDTSDSICCGK